MKIKFVDFVNENNVKFKKVNKDGKVFIYTLLDGEINDGDLVISKHQFDSMDENGNYFNGVFNKNMEVFVYKAKYEIIDGERMLCACGACGNVLKTRYSKVFIKYVENTNNEVINKYLIKQKIPYEGKNTWTVLASSQEEAKQFVKDFDKKLSIYDLEYELLKSNIKGTKEKGIVKYNYY